MYLVNGSSLPPTWPLVFFFSVMSAIHLIIRGFQSPSAPSPTPASPSQSSSSQGAATVRRTYSLCLRRRMSIVTFNCLTFLYCVPWLR